MKQFLLSLFISFPLLAFSSPKIPDPRCIQEVRNFEGDRHGDFRNDFEVVLCDGSSWKIHPKDRGLFSRWQLKDEIEVGVRTSFYFFKREHKFYLYNLTRDEEARVMLANYSEMPLYISVAQTDLFQEHYVPRTWTDDKGKTHTTYDLKRTYAKKVILSDGSVWTLKDEKDFNSFTTGTRVYLSRDPKHEEIGFFLVTGVEREAIWTKASW